MGKKGKKGKAKKVKESESSEPDPNIHFGQDGTFEFPNGDKYVGDFCAHKYGIAWREGRGTYTTHDQQIYEGEWKDDKLVDDKELIIKYPAGAEYYGPTLKSKYNGPGTYVFENRMLISCEFFDNQPKGEIRLIDIKGKMWEGIGKKDEALLLPENIFYLKLPDSRGIGRSKLEEELVEGQQEVEEATELSDRELEKLIFAKSKKTNDDLRLEQSKWYGRYMRFKETKKKVFDKINDEGVVTLTNKERKWYVKYMEHKNKELENEKKKSQDALVDFSLLKTFYSQEYKEKWPVLTIFRPGDKIDEIGEELLKDENLEPDKISGA